MLIERLVWLAFGGTFLTSLFMLASFAYIAHCERQFGILSSLRHKPFVLAFFLCLFSIGLAINTGVRLIDGFENQHILGSSPIALLLGILLMWLAAAGFHWTATGAGRRIWWKLYLVVIALWIITVSWPILPL